MHGFTVKQKISGKSGQGCEVHYGPQEVKWAMSHGPWAMGHGPAFSKTSQTLPGAGNFAA